MGLIKKFFLALFVLFFAFIYQKYRNLTKPFEVPEIKLDKYWGPGDKSTFKEKTEILDFHFHVEKDVIEELRERLNNTNLLHEPLEGVNCEYGMNTNVLKKVINYWRDVYLPKWKSREEHISSLPLFTTEIQGLNISFIHTKVISNPKNKKVYAVLIPQGFPGSFVQNMDFIKRFITDPNDEQQVLFEVVAPTLPGDGWSQAPSKPGFDTVEAAVLFHNLMLRLGYTKYFIQGLTFGTTIGSNIVTLFPDALLGFHAVLCAINTPLTYAKYFLVSLKPEWFLDKDQISFYYSASEKLGYKLEETGYIHLQSTKPDTIGAALTDNPIGLASYILEKLSTWTNPAYRYEEECGIGKDFTMDQLLDHIMISYLTNSIQTALRFYKELYGRHQVSFDLIRVPTNVPTACVRVEHDISNNFDWQLQEKYTSIVHTNHINDGGHFFGFQNPDLLYNDFLEFAHKILKL